MKKQKLLITGGAGGIGSVFINQLDDKFEIDIVDNLHNGSLGNIKNKNINFIQADISEDSTYKLLKYNYDFVFHFAAISSLPFCESNKELAFKYNFLGTYKLIEFCRDNNIKNFCFSSTSAIYENNDEKVFNENLAVKPDLIYPLSKKFSEELLYSYSKNYGMNIIILRFFNVFGPNQDIKRKSPPLLNYLIREFYLDNSPTLHSDGKQSRDYIYVKDLVNLFLKILENPKTGIFNVCSGKLLSVNEILNYVLEYFNKNLNDVLWRDPSNLWDNHKELFQGHFSLSKERVSKEALKFSLGDNSKISETYNWSPQTDFRNLIFETIDESIEIFKNS